MEDYRLCLIVLRKKRQLALILLVFAVILMLWPFVLYASKVSKIGIQFELHESAEFSQPVKTIAMGSLMFGGTLKRYSNVERTRRGNVCLYVQDYHSSDAVLFHGPEMFYWNPVLRPLGQVWVILLDESPANVQIVMADGKFNLTFGYMHSSDVLFTYGFSRRLPLKGAAKRRAEMALVDYADGKSGLGAARISQCSDGLHIVNERLTYLQTLRSHLPIDLFGVCLAGHRCPDEKCSNGVLGKKYKFFFAFENSMCKDYITEKFWEVSLRNNMVPVVQGGLSRQDYEDLAPPHSFIHVDDFSGPESLAEYLKYLDKNDTAYNEYHKWRATHIVYYRNPFEYLCDKLNDPSWSQTIDRFDDVFGQKFCRFPKSMASRSAVAKFSYYMQSHNMAVDIPFI